MKPVKLRHWCGGEHCRLTLFLIPRGGWGWNRPSERQAAPRQYEGIVLIVSTCFHLDEATSVINAYSYTILSSLINCS